MNRTPNAGLNAGLNTRSIAAASLCLLLAGVARAGGPASLSVELRIRSGRVSVQAMGRRERTSSTGEGDDARRRYGFDRRGRYGAQLRTGGKPLGDPVRFDFPLLADADAGEARELSAKLRANVSSAAWIELALPPADARAELVVTDEKTGRSWRFPVPAALPAVTRGPAAWTPASRASPAPPPPPAPRSPLWHPAPASATPADASDPAAPPTRRR